MSHDDMNKIPGRCILTKTHPQSLLVTRFFPRNKSLLKQLIAIQKFYEMKLISRLNAVHLTGESFN